MHCIKLYCFYFKSAMCFVTIPLVDAATLFCLEVMAAEETKELFIICIIFKIIIVHNCFKIFTIGRGLGLFRPIVIVAFLRFLSKMRYRMSSQMHCLQQLKAKVVSIMQILYRLCLQMLPQFARLKKCKVAVHALQAISLDSINVGSQVG